MNIRQTLLGVIALVVYTGAIFSLGKQFQTQVAAEQARFASAGGSHSCGGGMEGMGGCGEHGPQQPAVAKLVVAPQLKLSDGQKASFTAAIKRHKAVVEKANADLATAVIKIAKLGDKSKKDLECQLNITTGVHPASASTGGCGAGGGCGMGGSAHGCPAPAPKAAAPKKTTTL